jgi:hypothetical protein
VLGESGQVGVVVDGQLDAKVLGQLGSVTQLDAA